MTVSLHRAVVESTAWKAVAEFGELAPLFGSYVAQQLRATEDHVGNIIVTVTDAKGRERNGTTVDQLISEIRGDPKFKHVFVSAPKEPTALTAETTINFTEVMRSERTRRAEAAKAGMTTDERASAKRQNPWRKGPSWNLTEQMSITRRDPMFAAYLELSAMGTA